LIERSEKKASISYCDVTHSVSLPFHRSNEIASFSALSFACKNDENLRHILAEALMICCIDNRRLPFFAAFISNEDSFLADTNNELMQTEKKVITGSTRLMLFLELVSFRDLFGVTPMHRQLFAAKRIAYKFLLPQPQDNGSTSKTANPQFDMRSMFAPEVISTLDKSIKEDDISSKLFCDIEEFLRDSFAGMKFASFLLSDECARMRAYMRSTSPYLDPSLECLFKESLDPESENFSSAQNHLEYIMIYLLCQSENDILDKNYNTKKENDQSGNERVMGSAGGLCCAIFIKRVLMPSINKAKELLLQNKIGEMDKVGQTLIDSYSSFWEYFIAPSGGTLESTPLSNDTQIMLDKVRRSVSLSASPPRNFSRDERRRHIIRSLALNNDLAKSLLRLREELIYDYSVNSHPKYRGHTFHEWMCAEVNKAEHNKPITGIDLVRSESTETGNIDTNIVNVAAIPQLPSGCISRLIRRLDFPDGLSRHCPEVKSISTSNHLPPAAQQQEQQQEESPRCNADYAIVFGTDNSDGESGREIPIEIAETEPSALRRFICVPMSKRAEEKLDAGEYISPTLESYAYVPIQGEREFQQTMDPSRKT
jgi:hypothetical protein